MSNVDVQGESRGDVMQRLHRLERRMQREEAARRLEAAAVGRGGIRVRGGQVAIQDDAGQETMRLASGELSLAGALDVTGRIASRYDSGRSSAFFGSFANAATGEVVGDGVLIQDDIDGASTILAAQRQDLSFVSIGSYAPGLPQHVAVGLFAANAEQVIVNSETSNNVFADGDVNIIPANTLFLFPDSGDIAANPSGTTGSANLLITGTTSGFIRRITSSAAAKVDVEDVEVDTDAVMRLRPRTWRDRGEVAEDPSTDRWHVGLIAEEVDATGLTEFVDYDEDGHPVAVTYDRLAVALLKVVQEQQRRLDALDGGAGDRQQPAQRKPKRRARRGQGEPAPTPVQPRAVKLPSNHRRTTQ